MDIKAGQTYIAKRDEIVNPKPKYHLYLADDIVFLINSNPNLHDFDIPLQMNDWFIFTKECYLQVKSIYRFDNKYKIIAVSDMSERALNALNAYLKDKTIKKSIPKMFIDRAIGIIETCLEERKLQNWWIIYHMLAW